GLVVEIAVVQLADESPEFLRGEPDVDDDVVLVQLFAPERGVHEERGPVQALGRSEDLAAETVGDHDVIADGDAEQRTTLQVRRVCPPADVRRGCRVVRLTLFPCSAVSSSFLRSGGGGRLCAVPTRGGEGRGSGVTVPRGGRATSGTVGDSRGLMVRVACLGHQVRSRLRLPEAAVACRVRLSGAAVGVGGGGATGRRGAGGGPAPGDRWAGLAWVGPGRAVRRGRLRERRSGCGGRGPGCRRRPAGA